MFVIGVTGGIGSGKTTVARMLGSWGMPVIDADRLSADVTDSGGAALPELAEAFGGRIVNADGALNRPLLADLIFQNHAARDRVNRIVHAYVLKTMGEEIDRLTKKKVKAVVLDVPLPVKEGFLDRAHFVIAVTADDAIRLERLRRRGMSEADAKRRMAVQLPQADYAALADREIRNDGSLEQLEADVAAVMVPELRKRGVALTAMPSDVEAE